MRTHPESLSPSLAPRFQSAPDVRPVLLAAVPPGEVQMYSAGPFTRLAAHTTADAIAMVTRARPRLVVIDWDLRDVDGQEVCRVAASLSGISVLVTTAQVQRVPAALKAGCHAVLLKPFVPNLLAARLGRLFRETARLPPSSALQSSGTGTNRVWPDTSCPTCATLGATSFEFSSHRRMWYACLACEHVWLGRRQEW